MVLENGESDVELRVHKTVIPSGQFQTQLRIRRPGGIMCV